MAVYKCKMCGAELSVTEGNTVVECDFCGTTQTVPSAKDENLQGLFNRANTLRIKSEFDKAEQIYERILQEDDTQPEAYWGLILCKFGIEYVEDPVTFKRIPTCHRTSFDSIVSDEDYKSALEHADFVQRGIYEAEAKEIDRLQKDIIALSQREDPYDVFICYKETDESGRRTHDSVIANDIYYQLTQEGFKVFYAAITLEDKLGSSYEPCIFSALNSAKVMLAIGTKPEYFNAVWVKNEWSRFLKIMKNDRSKVLIPCYRDMDAYELPDEFAHLQAQDMSKIGFINDVIRGIKKLLSVNEPQGETKENITINSGNANTSALLQRVFIFLEDGNWSSADEYCEKVLDLEPQNSLAYLGKLMAELKIKTQSDLMAYNNPIENNNNFQKAIRFADEEIKNNLVNINNSIQSNLFDEKYNMALHLKNTATSEHSCIEAATLFEQISAWKDSQEQAKECLEKATELKKDRNYSEALELRKKRTEYNLKRAIELLREIEGWKDSVQLIEEYEYELKNVLATNEERYNKAMCDLENGKHLESAGKYKEALGIYKIAIDKFIALEIFKDSKEKADWCNDKVQSLSKNNNSFLTFMVLDSSNPLAAADGCHYIYQIKNNKTNQTEKVTVTLRKGITTHQVRLSPGDYNIDLHVYAYDMTLNNGLPLYTTSCSLHLAPFEHWKAESNRPSLFGKLKISLEKL